MDTARFLTWNLERKNPLAGLGRSAVDHLTSHRPDVMVLTESRITYPERGGYLLSASPPVGPWFDPHERKVMIWSAQPWSAVTVPHAHNLDPSRFVAASTRTPIGEVTVLGVCIPWHMAEVTHRAGEKRKPWELHIDYLETLIGVLRAVDGPIVVAGDFNQRVPRQRYGNRRAATTLEMAFEPLTIVTAGTIDGCERPGIDHIAVSADLEPVAVWGWPNDRGGLRMSDHDGAAVVLRRARS